MSTNVCKFALNGVISSWENDVPKAVRNAPSWSSCIVCADMKWVTWWLYWKVRYLTCNSVALPRFNLSGDTLLGWKYFQLSCHKIIRNLKSKLFKNKLHTSKIYFKTSKNESLTSIATACALINIQLLSFTKNEHANTFTYSQYLWSLNTHGTNLTNKWLKYWATKNSDNQYSCHRQPIKNPSSILSPFRLHNELQDCKKGYENLILILIAS